MGIATCCSRFPFLQNRRVGQFKWLLARQPASTCPYFWHLSHGCLWVYGRCSQSLGRCPIMPQQWTSCTRYKSTEFIPPYWAHRAGLHFGGGNGWFGFPIPGRAIPLYMSLFPTIIAGIPGCMGLLYTASLACGSTLAAFMAIAAAR